jgi:formylglycine-generating enzyme required for sulfatase activity
MDATEVNNAQYAAFLAAGYPTGLNNWCSWNTTQVPTNAWPATGRNSYPVVFVDWCDAFDYCAWAGKRLCELPELQNACTKMGSQAYPYGNTYDGAKCVGYDFNGTPGSDGQDAARPVGTPTCEGGFSGVFDLTGNVYEWANTCFTYSGYPYANCNVSGGSFKTAASCATATGDNIDIPANDLGFRCCAATL